MGRLTVFFFVFAICLALSTASGCYNQCKFNFCYSYPSIFLGFPDYPLSGPICRAHQRIGYIDETGEAYVYKNYRFTPISKWHPLGLKQKFTPSFFKAYALSWYPASGVGHETAQQNQLDFFKTGPCIILPIKKYQKFKRNGDVVNVNPGNPYTECVSFTANRYYYY